MEATVNLEDRVRAWEAEFLSELATPSYPAERRAEEPDSPLRTPFQRDRDRIVHSKAFRRLKHKTQVFIAPEGDHYRTRLTHTLEACGIARTVARALALNEDLTEAIGLGHDLGHPPFGHSGEEALDAAAARPRRRRLQAQRALAAGRRRARARRRRPQPDRARSATASSTTPGSNKPATLEGRIVKLVDRVAYINHDIDDALRAGVLRPSDLPAEEIELLGPTGSARIDTLVRDIVAHSTAEAGDIVQSEEVGGAMLRLRKFMFDRVYLAPAARARAGAGPAHPARPLRPLHGAPRGDAGGPSPGRTTRQRVTDYLAGMTDRFCIARFTELTVPEEARVLRGADLPREPRARSSRPPTSSRSSPPTPTCAARAPAGSGSAPSTRSARRRSRSTPRKSSTTASAAGSAATRSSSSKRRRGSASPRRSSCSPSATGSSSSARRRTRGPRRGGAQRAPARGAARPHRRLLRAPTSGTPRRRRRRATTWPSAGSARRCCAPSGSATRRAPGTRSCCAASGPASRSTSCAASGWPSAGGAAASTTASARGSCSRSATAAAARSASAAGRCAPTRGQVRQHRRDRLLPQEPDALRDRPARKAAIAKAGRAVVVEGYTDVLALHQAGVEEAVGVMGTAITEEQVATLSGMVEEVVLALDADSAGQEAMLRAQRVAGRAQDADPGRGDAGRRGPGRDDGRRGRRGALPGAGRGRRRALRLPGRAGARRAPTPPRPPSATARSARWRRSWRRWEGGREPRRPRPPGRRAARPRAGDGDGPGGRGAAAERRPPPPANRDAPRVRRRPAGARRAAGRS